MAGTRRRCREIRITRFWCLLCGVSQEYGEREDEASQSGFHVAGARLSPSIDAAASEAYCPRIPDESKAQNHLSSQSKVTTLARHRRRPADHRDPRAGRGAQGGGTGRP